MAVGREICWVVRRVPERWGNRGTFSKCLLSPYVQRRRKSKNGRRQWFPILRGTRRSPHPNPPAFSTGLSQMPPSWIFLEGPGWRSRLGSRLLGWHKISRDPKWRLTGEQVGGATGTFRGAPVSLLRWPKGSGHTRCNSNLKLG